MTATALTFTTAGYAATPWRRKAKCETREAPQKDYALYDQRGRQLGTVVAPEARPEGGRGAPTVFLRRAF